MKIALFLASSLLPLTSLIATAEDNLLLNPEFGFSSFEPLRDDKASSGQLGSVPFWEGSRYDAVRVFRAPGVSEFRPKFPVDGVVAIQPGGTLSQWVLVSEGKLEPGTPISLAVNGFRPKGAKLRFRLNAMMTDGQEGEWKPSEFGMPTTKSYPKAARGEFTPRQLAEVTPEAEGAFEARLEGVLLPGGKDQPTQAVAVEVLVSNEGEEQAWIYAPRLVHGEKAPAEPLPGRELPEEYRSLPRTLSKLNRGDALHIIVMGSSIDRASANPPLYRYDEDPASPTFKQPLSKASPRFVGEDVGRPELTPYYGNWAHYYSSYGRLRERLMRRFNLPASKLLLNFMACDGSSIGEAHSALARWSTLSQPPSPWVNGVGDGASWQELHPELFSRPEGPRPDLVIFGAGANERIDGVEELAAYEGAVRWFQRHYPDTEFLIAMWSFGEKTRGAVMMRQLALRYGIPVVEVGREFALMTRHVNPNHLRPRDGHPQAGGHDLWGRLMERAFQVVDPIKPGLPQRQLPERISPYTVNWEGEMTTYDAASPRIRRKRGFIADDAMLNVWASGKVEKGKKLEFAINGVPSTDDRYESGSRRVPNSKRDERNSALAIGRLPLGERHFVEVTTPEAELIAVDAKTALNRRWHPISSALWEGRAATPERFASEWGAPYGEERLMLQPGQKVALSWAGTLASVAWLQQPGGGTLVASLDGAEPMKRATGELTKLAEGTLHMEDRSALPQLPYGVHRLEVTAEGGPVALLGAFTYDTRANREAERVQAGIAAPGDRLTFSAAYQATPLVICAGGLKVERVSPTEVIFSGTAPGNYQVMGE